MNIYKNYLHENNEKYLNNTEIYIDKSKTKGFGIAVTLKDTTLVINKMYDHFSIFIAILKEVQYI